MSRVIDCVMFNDEWDLLALRFATLVDAVDTFIVVEGDRTHSGKARRSMAGRIADMAPPHKQCIVVTCPLPSPLPDRWVPERVQRNAMLMGLFDARAEADDHVLMGDVDEIPDPAAVRFTGLHRQRQFLYHLNAAFDAERWPGTIGLPYGQMLYVTPAGVRAMNGQLPSIESGWHFSYMGGVEGMTAKLASFAHDEWDTAETRQGLAANMAALTDPLGRSHVHARGRIVPIDASFPLPLQREPARWAHMLAEVPA